MTSKGLGIETTIPVWAIICAIFAAGGLYYLTYDNKDDIAQVRLQLKDDAIQRKEDNREFKSAVVELSKTVTLLNETIIRMDERSANDSKIAHKNEQRSLENEKKLVTHEIEINNLKKAITK
ncbi:hypothetical protein phiV208_21 [Vibrio phage phiV208]|nr:hypothetical protein phiV208_21 [Vibrio phage phiV208]